MLEKRYTHLAAVQADLASGKISCLELAKYYLDRIGKYQHLNAYLEVYTDEVLQQAKTLDKKLATGEPVGRLHGLFLGVKDLICYENHQITAGSKILEGFTSLYSATAVSRVLAEDAIILGRQNCDEFAMGSSNENSAYGVVRNAYDTSRVPGGSSGGSAVAVQADLCLAALGTDTGGSVRQPASFCDLIGLKPTYSRISRHGLIAYGSSFDQVGVFSHSMEDTALLLEIMAGKDGFDATASSRPVPAYSKLLNFEGKAKIAYFQNALEHPGLNPQIQQQIKQLLMRLVADGHEVLPVEFPPMPYIVPTYYILTAAESSSNLARFDGMHYGYRAQMGDLESTYRHTRTTGFGTEVKRRIMLGTFVLSAGYYDAYYAKAQKVRRIIQDTTLKIFEEFDFIVTPTTPTTAFRIGDKAYRDPVSMYLADIFTVQPSLAGIPAISLPLFQHSDGLPFGLQLMANKFEEAKLMAFGQQLMANYGMAR